MVSDKTAHLPSNDVLVIRMAITDQIRFNVLTKKITQKYRLPPAFKMTSLKMPFNSIFDFYVYYYRAQSLTVTYVLKMIVF